MGALTLTLVTVAAIQLKWPFRGDLRRTQITQPFTRKHIVTTVVVEEVIKKFVNTSENLRFPIVRLTSWSD